MTLPIDTSFLTSGADWNVGSVDGSAGAGAAGATAPSAGGSGFGSVLTDQLGKLEATQNDAAQASQDLATDPESVVMAVERARLSMQLASTLRTKAVEAVNDIFHTQV